MSPNCGFVELLARLATLRRSVLRDMLRNTLLRSVAKRRLQRHWWRIGQVNAKKPGVFNRRALLLKGFLLGGDRGARRSGFIKFHGDTELAAGLDGDFFTGGQGLAVTEEF